MRVEFLDNLEEVGWKRVRLGTGRGQLILDHESGTEVFLKTTGLLLVVFSVFALFEREVLSNGQFLEFTIIGLAAGGLLTFLGWIWSDYFVVDTMAGRLYVVRKIGGFEVRFVLCRLDKLRHVVLNPRRHSSKSKVWWEYPVAVVQSNGRVRELLNSSDTRAYYRSRTVGKLLGKLLEIPYADAPAEHFLKIRNRWFRPEPYYKRYNQVREILITLAVGLVAVALFFLLPLYLN